MKATCPGSATISRPRPCPARCRKAGTRRRSATMDYTANSCPARPSPRPATRTNAPGAIASGPRSSTPTGFPDLGALVEIGAEYRPRHHLAWPVPLGSVTVPAGEKLTWITGMRTMVTAGDVNTQAGMASHMYLVNTSMKDEYFFSADGELLVVPQKAACGSAPNLASSTWNRARSPSCRVAWSTASRCWKARRAGSSARTMARSSSFRPRSDRRQLQWQPARLQDPGGGL